MKPWVSHLGIAVLSLAMGAGGAMAYNNYHDHAQSQSLSNVSMQKNTMGSVMPVRDVSLKCKKQDGGQFCQGVNNGYRVQIFESGNGPAPTMKTVMLDEKQMEKQFQHEQQQLQQMAVNMQKQFAQVNTDMAQDFAQF